MLYKNYINAGNALNKYFDCAVMLTQSYWKTEGRKNRYFYATRFARHLPVLFVQPDQKQKPYLFEESGYQNIDILHAKSKYTIEESFNTPDELEEEACDMLERAILSRGFEAPLLWSYNVHFSSFVFRHPELFKVYHATEDYYHSYFDVYKNSVRPKLKKLLSRTDLLVAVSEDVLSSQVVNGNYAGESLLLLNGVDYSIFAPSPKELEYIINSYPRHKKIVLYQGGINKRLDFNLLEQLADILPNWEFWFCGDDIYAPTESWNRLRTRSNVKYLGNLPPQGIRTVSYQATVGIIPYRYEDTSYSMPLKAFEYVACGLPVVSVPIHALLDNPQQFTIASDANEFAIKIQEVASTRWDAEALKQRLAIAAEWDYDHNFEKLCQKIEALIFTNTLSSSRPYISVLRASDGRKAKWTQEINRVVDETAIKLSSRPQLFRMIHLVYKYTIKRFIR